MDRRTSLASSFGFTAMLGGALFTIVAVLFAVVLSRDPGQALESTANTLIVVSMLLLTPGVVGLYLAHRDVFGRVETAVVAAHGVGIFFFPVFKLLQVVLGSVPHAEVLGSIDLLLLVVGGLGAGIAVAYREVFAHARLGGGLLAVAVVSVVALGPLLGALGLLAAIPEFVVALLVFGPVGAAWLVLGYDMLTIREGGVPSIGLGANRRD